MDHRFGRGAGSGSTDAHRDGCPDNATGLVGHAILFPCAARLLASIATTGGTHCTSSALLHAQRASGRSGYFSELDALAALLVAYVGLVDAYRD